MFWFRVALIFTMFAVFVWILGETTGILLKWTNGESVQSMELDPAKNGTMATYVFILMFLFFLMGCCLFGFVLCFLVWKNKFQMDHELRHYFVIWLGLWVAAIFGNMGISIYALVRNKDPQGQMGIMYEMFQKGAHDTKFIATYERFQRENSCCGIYGPDDWLMIQLRSQPGGVGMGAFQSMDYGFQQNPSSGKCHMIPPTVPPGCGQKMLQIVNSALNLFAALTMVLVVMAAAVGIIAWYCFFYWLEKEVIVIPEDEVSNIIVVEPEPSDTSQRSYHPSLRSAGYIRHTDYLPPGSYIRHGESIYQHPYPPSYRSLPREPTRRTVVYTRPSRRHTNNMEASRTSRYDREPSRVSRFHPDSHRPSRYSQHHSGGLHNNHTQILNRNEHYSHHPITHGYLGSGYLGPGTSHQSHHSQQQPHHETVLEKQEHALGGHILAEMHVDHELDKGKENIAQRPQGSSKHQAHHATIAIVRNKHLHDPPPKLMANHGHTGHLAEDIAEMSGRNALPKLDDVFIPVDGANHHHQTQRPPTPIVSLGSVTGNRAQNTIEDVMLPEHLKREKKERDKGTIADKNLMMHAHYLPGMTPPGSINHGHGGRESVLQNRGHSRSRHNEHPQHGGYLGGSNLPHDHTNHYLNPGHHENEHEHDHHSHYQQGHRVSGVVHHPTIPFLGPPPQFVTSHVPDHHHRPSTAGHHHLQHENHSREHHEMGHHPHNPSTYEPSHHIRHIDPAHGSLVRREDRSRSRSRERSHSGNTKVLFKNPHVLEDSD